MNFRTNLREIRKHSGLTQVQLAEETNLTRSMVASYEQGVAEPSFCNLIKICKCLDVTPNQLLK